MGTHACRCVAKKETTMAEPARVQDLGEEFQVDKSGKYLTFGLSKEEYGVGILKVKEIIGMMPITSVPQTPDFVKGVINLRGKVIPVIDLRRKFGMTVQEYTERTCIIVVEIAVEHGSILMGIVVDSVSEVIQLKNEDIEETPTFGTRLNVEYILGIAKTNDGVKILLDIDRVLTAKEISMLDKAV